MVNLGSPVTGGAYETHTDTLGKGGARGVATTAARNAIPTYLLSPGMLVSCQDTGLTYKLKTLYHTPLVNADWDQYAVMATTAPMTLYVDPAGSDTNDGLTAIAPIRTIKHFVTDMLPNMLNYSPITLNCAPGTYAEYIPFMKLALDKLNGVIVELIFQGASTTLLGTQTPTSGTLTNVTVAGAGLTPSVHKGKIIRFTSGPVYNACVALGSEPYFAVYNNSTDTWEIVNTTNVIPGPTDRFIVIDNTTILDGSAWYYLLRYNTPRGLRVNCRNIRFQNADNLVSAGGTISKFVACQFIGGKFQLSMTDCGNTWLIGNYFFNAAAGYASIFNTTSDGPIVMGCVIDNAATGGWCMRNDGSGSINCWGVRADGGGYGVYVGGGSFNASRGVVINNMATVGIHITGYNSQFRANNTATAINGSGNAIGYRMQSGGRITTSSAGSYTGTIQQSILSNGTIYDQNTGIMWTEKGGEISGKQLTTSDNVQAPIITIPMDDNTTLGIKADVACQNGTQRSAIFVEGTVYRNGGTATIQGTITSIHNQGSDPGISATITVSGNNAYVSVTGLAVTSLNWTANASFIKTA